MVVMMDTEISCISYQTSRTCEPYYTAWSGTLAQLPTKRFAWHRIETSAEV